MALLDESLLATGPLVVGATGGSGTRVVARILREATLFTGSDLNESEDAWKLGDYGDRWINLYPAPVVTPGTGGDGDARRPGTGAARPLRPRRRHGEAVGLEGAAQHLSAALLPPSPAPAALPACRP